MIYLLVIFKYNIFLIVYVIYYVFVIILVSSSDLIKPKAWTSNVFSKNIIFWHVRTTLNFILEEQTCLEKSHFALISAYCEPLGYYTHYCMQILYFVSFFVTPRWRPTPGRCAPSRHPDTIPERYLADDLLRVHSSEVSTLVAWFNDVGGEMLPDFVHRHSLAHFRCWQCEVALFKSSRTQLISAL